MEILPASFRDPSGFLFIEAGSLLRQINTSYGPDYDHLMNSGLYDRLTESGLLVPHVEVDDDGRQSSAYKTIRPEPIPFVSYPYEWCFSQLKDAALATLKIHKIALDHGMTLKDASAYNIQFKASAPVLIDTLSFRKKRSGEPWVAYRQFCQHFLAPLALKSMTDHRLNQLSRVFVDGPPLDLASSILPWRSRLKLSLLSHVHLHARSQAYFADKGPATAKVVSDRAQLGLIDNLETAVRKLNFKRGQTEWADYYDKTNYGRDSFEHKRNLVAGFLSQIEPAPKSLLDLGANTGVFSRVASRRGIHTVSLDVDPVSVEKNYLRCRKDKDRHLLPLQFDLTNPSPAIGWDNKERMSLVERGPVDCVFALALLHHLAISNNVPFARIAEFLSGLSSHLIIEFVPKEDSQVKKLLSSREDIFDRYNQREFERDFGRFFETVSSERIRNSERTLYLMKKNAR